MLRLLLPRSKSLKSPPLKHSFSTSSSFSIDDPSCSLTIHFLRSSCGLSPESALAASGKIHLKTTKNPHSILRLLKLYDLTPADITKLVARHPKLLLSDPDKTLKPKLDFFVSVGFSGPHLISLVTSVPKLLQFSLENKLIRNYNLLKTLLDSDANAKSAVNCAASLLVSNLNEVLIPKIKTLEEYGVPRNVLLKLLTMHCNSLVDRPNRFQEIFDMLKRIRISPTSPIFAHAFGVLGKLSERLWDQKVENFKKLGWSDEQVVLAFTKHPYCMSVSMEKIVKNMEFYRDKFGWEPEYVSRNPVVLSFSYEKRIVPRYRVLRALEEKGLYNGRVGSRQMMLGEKEFLKKYVVEQYEQIPEITGDDLIRAKIDSLGLLKRSEN